MRTLSNAFTLVVFFCLFSSISFATGMAIMGDAGKAGKALNNLKASLLKENVTSVIMPGDNLYSGTYDSVWNDWKKRGINFDVVAIGNHNDGYAAEIKYFQMPGEFYSVVKQGARFIVLNSDNTLNVSAQFTWLRKEMTRIKESLIFITYHHPTFTISKSHTWTEKREFQLQMRDFLNQYHNRITALFLGHDHVSEFLNFGPVPVVVSGAGREADKPKAVSFKEDGFQVETKYLTPGSQHWGLLEILPGAKEAVVNFIRVSDQKRVCAARFRNSEMILEGECRQ
jgi:hypothetical protein